MLYYFAKRQNKRSNPTNRTIKEQEHHEGALVFYGAGSRGRTDTVLLPSDFESDASANSTIPAYGADFFAQPHYSITIRRKNQYVFYKKRKKLITSEEKCKKKKTYYCNFYEFNV